jgi:hypothetical protein
MTGSADNSTQSQATEGEPLHGDINDPEFRHRRAVKAGKARQTPKAHIDALIRQVGRLTDEDWARLRQLLPPPAARADEGAA